MKILAKPAFSNKEKNPYNYLLYSRIERDESCTVDEFTPRRALLNRYDILHFHWPEVMLSDRSVILSLITTIAFLLLVRWMKFRGTQFVWTVHDLRSHKFSFKSSDHQRIEQWYWNKFIGLLDGIIALSDASLKEAVQTYPALSKKKHFVVPHGHYKDIYPDTISRPEAREKWGISEQEMLITYFGQIRPYKNVPRLIRSFLDADRDNYRLLIAGNPTNQQLEKEIKSLAQRKSSHIKTILKFIPQEEVQQVFRASDLVVIPYRDILNSGSVILSLSFDVPVLVPGKGSIVELKEIFGDQWVKTYEGKLTADILEKNVQEVRQSDANKCHKIDDFSWDKIARQTLLAYRELVAE